MPFSHLPWVSLRSVSALSRYSPFALLAKFDAAVTLEGQLRSNANYGLMLESFLIRNF